MPLTNENSNIIKIKRKEFTILDTRTPEFLKNMEKKLEEFNENCVIEID